MLGRQVVLLLRGGPAARSRLARPSLRDQCHHDLCALLPRASYSTPSRPKKAVGEPSRPVKRTPAAAKKAQPTSTTKTPARASRAKAPAAKKKADAKPKAKKPAAKPKKAKKPAKPVLTEEQKEVQKAKALRTRTLAKETKEKEKIKELKALALDPPHVTTANAYAAFIASKGAALKSTTGQKDFADHARNVSAQYKNASPAEMEHYNHLAHVEKERDEAAYKSYVESHTVERIQQANAARRTLRRRFPVPKHHHPKWPAIRDERAPKPLPTGFVLFNAVRQQSPDFKNIAFVDRIKLVADEWKNLEPAEKEKYRSTGAKDNSRPVAEVREAMGTELPAGQYQAAAASA